MARKPDPIANQLRIYRDLGFGFLEAIEEPGTEAEASPPDMAEAPDLDRAGRLEELDRIACEVAGCSACRLFNSRTNVVPGEGDPEAPLMFIGEGPGADEDIQGRPFVGRAGQLLTRIIEAMQFRREEVFIANVVKCRPPGNRQPETDEMEACVGYLHRQVAVVRPRVVVTLGKTALMGLLPEHRRSSITRVRGQWLEFDGVPLMPTFHPAYLLRSPNQKRFVWEDMQEVMKVFGKTPTGKK